MLMKWSSGAKVEKRLHDRAKIILSCLNGKKNIEVATELGVSRFTVAKWRNRFAIKGIEGLTDSFRSGKSKTYDTNYRNRVFQTLDQPPPKGQSYWDGQSLAVAVNGSDNTVWRILRKEGIQLQRCRSWCVSRDKEFSKKSADIISSSKRLSDMCRWKAEYSGNRTKQGI